MRHNFPQILLNQKQVIVLRLQALLANIADIIKHIKSVVAKTVQGKPAGIIEPGHIKEVKLLATQKFLIVYLIASPVRPIINKFSYRFGSLTKT